MFIVFIPLMHLEAPSHNVIVCLAPQSECAYQVGPWDLPPLTETPTCEITYATVVHTYSASCSHGGVREHTLNTRLA